MGKDGRTVSFWSDMVRDGEVGEAHFLEELVVQVVLRPTRDLLALDLLSKLSNPPCSTQSSRQRPLNSRWGRRQEGGTDLHRGLVCVCLGAERARAWARGVST